MTKISQLQANASTLGSLVGIKPVKVFPNGTGTGWQVIYKDGDQDRCLLSLKGTITECYNKLDVAIDIIRNVQEIEKARYIMVLQEDKHDLFTASTYQVESLDAGKERLKWEGERPVNRWVALCKVVGEVSNKKEKGSS